MKYEEISKGMFVVTKHGDRGYVRLFDEKMALVMMIRNKTAKKTKEAHYIKDLEPVSPK